MRHVKKVGSNNRVFILLHGTGGSADSLFDIANFIDEEATLIGFEGQVLENGMRRYFERYPDGTFKLRSLAEATEDLYASMNTVLDEYPDAEVVLMGYSNGANIALNILKEFENVKLDYAILFHPSPVRMDVPFKTQNDLKVLITSGQNDPFISEADFKAISNQLSEKVNEVKEVNHEYGHQLIQEELTETKKFLG